MTNTFILHGKAHKNVSKIVYSTKLPINSLLQFFGIDGEKYIIAVYSKLLHG